MGVVIAQRLDHCFFDVFGYVEAGFATFKAVGFVVVDFEEPRVTADRYHLAKTERQLKDCQTCPASVAFKLQKPKAA